MDDVTVSVIFWGGAGWTASVAGNMVAKRRYKYAIMEDIRVVVRTLKASGAKTVVITGAEALNMQTLYGPGVSP